MDVEHAAKLVNWTPCQWPSARASSVSRYSTVHDASAVLVFMVNITVFMGSFPWRRWTGEKNTCRSCAARVFNHRPRAMQMPISERRPSQAFPSTAIADVNSRRDRRKARLFAIVLHPRRPRLRPGTREGERHRHLEGTERHEGAFAFLPWVVPEIERRVFAARA